MDKPTLYFADINESQVDAFKKHLGDLDFCNFHHGSILDLEVNAVVSPANSFGFMDGGIDKVYTNYFGKVVQERLQRSLQERPIGELLVGEAIVVVTDDEKISFVISAPTMRTPQVLPKNTMNPYLATKAALSLWKRVGSNGSIAFSGMGTGVGGVSPDLCAYQMRKAVDHIISEEYKFPENWTEVHEHVFHSPR